MGLTSGCGRAAGLNYWQLGEANYWGHNAIVRRAPFGWGTMITKKLLNVGRDDASCQHARTFCRLGPPDAYVSAV